MPTPLFQPGNPGGPGRPPKEVERRYQASLHSIVTMDRWHAICEQAVMDALDPDDPKTRNLARTWLGRHLLIPLKPSTTAVDDLTAQLHATLLARLLGAPLPSPEPEILPPEDEP